MNNNKDKDKDKNNLVLEEDLPPTASRLRKPRKEKRKKEEEEEESSFWRESALCVPRSFFGCILCAFSPFHEYE